MAPDQARRLGRRACRKTSSATDRWRHAWKTSRLIWPASPSDAKSRRPAFARAFRDDVARVENHRRRATGPGRIQRPDRRDQPRRPRQAREHAPGSEPRSPTSARRPMSPTTRHPRLEGSMRNPRTAEPRTLISSRPGSSSTSSGFGFRGSSSSNQSVDQLIGPPERSIASPHVDLGRPRNPEIGPGRRLPRYQDRRARARFVPTRPRLPRRVDQPPALERTPAPPDADRRNPVPRHLERKDRRRFAGKSQMDASPRRPFLSLELPVKTDRLPWVTVDPYALPSRIASAE